MEWKYYHQQAHNIDFRKNVASSDATRLASSFTHNGELSNIFLG